MRTYLVDYDIRFTDNEAKQLLVSYLKGIVLRCGVTIEKLVGVVTCKLLTNRVLLTSHSY